MRWLRAIITGWKDLLFPLCCPICGKVLEQENECICRDCLKLLPRTDQAVLRDNLTEDLFVDEPQFCRGASFLFYHKGKEIQHLLHLLKYGDYPQIGYELGRQAAYEYMQTDFFEDIKVIMPVPLHPNRLKKRGYNQSEWIARGLGDVLGIPVDTSHLTREVNNKKQALQKGIGREQNVAGIFAVNHPEELYHTHILLVDDIITTGSTLRSCMQTMRAFKGSKVSVFAIARAT
ncbi:MAG: ComF family protein [Paludibacteraceae bacterium]|nr:ComF family protein [Paludibacteraceae bacterium]